MLFQEVNTEFQLRNNFPQFDKPRWWFEQQLTTRVQGKKNVYRVISLLDSKEFHIDCRESKY